VEHIRIVSPPDLTPTVCDLFEKTPSVINVVLLPGAARKPNGDVIMADVAREDASVILADLRKMGLEQRGSIAIEAVDTAISVAADRAEKAASGSPADAVVWEALTRRTSEDASLTGSFLAFMVIAVLLAATGLVLDSAILLVGAMVVGPDFGPIAGFCVAAVQRRGAIALRSFAALAVGFPVAIGVAVGCALLGRWTGLGPEDFTAESESLARTVSHPDGYAVLIGLLAGTAGMLSLSTAKSGALIGVVISVTTIPAAAGIALSLAYGDTAGALGSLETLLLNLSAMLVGGTITLAVQRGAYARRRRTHVERTAARMGA
jgi:uncharacterized hydrophobic protein (TIGR00271 family)